MLQFLRRRSPCGTEHLGLITPQMSISKNDPVTGFMLPSPSPLPDESRAPGAELVIDPLDDGQCSYIRAFSQSFGI